MKITDITAEAGHLPHVTCRIDGVLCDVQRSGEEYEVAEVRHPSPVVLRGDAVPAELRAAYEACAEEAARNATATDEDRERCAGAGPHFVGGPHFLGRDE